MTQFVALFMVKLIGGRLVLEKGARPRCPRAELTQEEIVALWRRNALGAVRSARCCPEHGRSLRARRTARRADA